MGVLDALTAVWMTTVGGILFIAIPTFWPFAPQGSQFAGRLARVVVLTVIGVRVLSALHLLSWFTLLLLYAAGPVAAWLRERKWQVHAAFTDAGRWTILWVARFSEWNALVHVVHHLIAVWSPVSRIKQAARVWLSEVRTASAALVTIGMVGTAVATILLRFDGPLHEHRLARPEAYVALLATQQLQHNDALTVGSGAFPAVAAATSVLSSLGAPDVIRFLDPLLNCALVFVVAFVVRLYTRTAAAAVVALWALGVFGLAAVSAALDPWWTARFGQALPGELSHELAAGDAELGALGLLLATICWHRREPAHVRQALIDTASCLVMVAVSSPALLLVSAVGALGALLPSPFALAVLAVGWLLHAAAALRESGAWLQDVSRTMPIGIVLLTAAVTCGAARVLRWLTADATDGVLIALCSALWLYIPSGSASRRHHLEYEAAARQTLEISKRFPRKQWLIVAPVEQLSFAYGLGWYQDLNQFVNDYQDKAAKPGFAFPFWVRDILVFVETRPYRTYPIEPLSVPFSVLTDPTYRAYRSPAGRASLEFAALKLCETYGRHHRDASIYYDDGALRIYRFNGLTASSPLSQRLERVGVPMAAKFSSEQ